MPIRSVQTLIKKWKMRDSVETKPWSGRPTKIQPQLSRKIVWDTKKKSAVIRCTSLKTSETSNNQN